MRFCIIQGKSFCRDCYFVHGRPADRFVYWPLTTLGGAPIRLSWGNPSHYSAHHYFYQPYMPFANYQVEEQQDTGEAQGYEKDSDSIQDSGTTVLSSAHLPI
jgi:hypothetical protein